MYATAQTPAPVVLADNSPETEVDGLWRLSHFRYCRKWGLDPGHDGTGDARARNDVLFSIGRLPRPAADKLLLQTIEITGDAARMQSCIASAATLARLTSLSEPVVSRTLPKLIRAGLLEEVELPRGQFGYRVRIDPDHLAASKAELRRLWQRTPEYTGWLDGTWLHPNDYGIVRLIFRAELLNSDLPTAPKAIGLSVALLTDRTGDAPFCAATFAEIAKLAGYNSPETVRIALKQLEAAGLLEIRPVWRSGAEYRLRIPNFEDIADRFVYMSADARAQLEYDREQAEYDRMDRETDDHRDGPGMPGLGAIGCHSISSVARKLLSHQSFGSSPDSVGPLPKEKEEEKARDREVYSRPAPLSEDDHKPRSAVKNCEIATIYGYREKTYDTQSHPIAPNPGNPRTPDDATRSPALENDKRVLIHSFGERYDDPTPDRTIAPGDPRWEGPVPLPAKRSWTYKETPE